MQKSIKQYILSTVFRTLSYEVMDNRVNNGFSVGMPGLINSYVFDKLMLYKDYFLEHHISWYVTSDEFPSYTFELPCIRFYDEVSE